MRNDAPDLLLGAARNVLRREVSRVIASDFSHIAAELKRIETEKAKVLAAPARYKTEIAPVSGMTFAAIGNLPAPLDWVE